MDAHTAPRITHVERLSGGAVVTFEDGKSALFSASLLYNTIPQAEDLTNLRNPDEEDGDL